MIEFTEEQMIDAENTAYLKAGHNAYFGNGFKAGVEFALEQINKNVDKSNVIESSKCKHCGAYTSFGATVCYGCACVRNA